MRVEKRNGYRVVVGGPVPSQAEAITLGKTIFVRERSCDDQALLAHELVHVRQFNELGPVGFLARYVGSYLRFRLGGFSHMAAYRRIPLEVEACWVSRLHSVHELAPGRRIVSSRTASNGRAFRGRLSRPRPRQSNDARPVPRSGAWNRPRRPSNLTAVQAAMARRDASDAASR